MATRAGDVGYNQLHHFAADGVRDATLRWYQICKPPTH